MARVAGFLALFWLIAMPAGFALLATAVNQPAKFVGVEEVGLAALSASLVAMWAYKRFPA